ncbi:hypothetical protein C5Z25_07925 [Lactobacillus sp. CBA3605]|uniref:hypothetical protein n=1 Tax=Lactobacillus sp. CBA3605 TaxID=2099788 RepID=UPI000CFDEEF2|nr:hypothetical protein [Lactobacillus sp. CBA3605]AVK61707.1 hypothetical protein C5Z25_07925 [Lactobacillus sp. CBA3605]
MVVTAASHQYNYCYLLELTGNRYTDLLINLTPDEQNMGTWERVYAANLPTWRLWTNANADMVRFVITHVIARHALPQNDYWLIQYQGHDHQHPKLLHPQFHTS